MERVSLDRFGGQGRARRWLLACLAPLMFAIAAEPVWAAPPAKAPIKSKRKKETREGSYIVNNSPMPEPPDLRGTYAKARDDEQITHYRRLARLDYIAQLAEADKDTRLLERVENVRKREIQRHRQEMTRFWEQARGRAMVGFEE